MSNILVTAKVNPDLDGVACTLAYADLLNRTGRPAIGLVFGHPQSEVEFFIKEQGIVIPITDKKDQYEGFILVDASSMKGMPEVVEKDKVVEIIDHRAGEPEKEFPQSKIQNDLIGAAATIIVERFQQSGLHPQPDHAKLLYGAIFHNTLNLTSSNTSDRDKAAIEYLELQFNLDPKLPSDMFRFSTNLIYSDLGQAINDDAKEFAAYNTKIGCYQLVLWEFSPGEWSSKISQSVGEADQKMGCSWSLLNVIDIKTNQSYIFCQFPIGQQIISRSFNLKFQDDWATMCPALLRKQIMPRILSSG